MPAKSILLIALCAFLSACTPGPPTESVEIEAAEEAPVPLPEPSPEQLANRIQFFSELQLSAIRAFEESFRRIDSPEDLLAAFDQAAGLGAKTLPPDDPWDPQLMATFDVFPQADLGIAGLHPSCVAECTVMTFSPNLDDWAWAATRTTSDLDDAFVDVITDYFGYPSFYQGGIAGYGRYFEQTWDYGGYSLLGSGVHTTLLKQIDYLRSRTSLFNRHLDAWRTQLIGDAAGWNVCFGSEASDVSKELKTLGALTTLTPEDRTTIEKRRSELAAADSPIETNCQDLSCSCSSG